jgi:ketosteroid isomerase-like protein
VQSLYAAFGRGDIATIVNACAPDTSWQVNGRPQDYPILGVRNGRSPVSEFFRQVAENQEANDSSPREFHPLGDLAIVLGHDAWKIRKTGKPAATNSVHIFWFKDGKVTVFREFTDTTQFADAWRG